MMIDLGCGRAKRTGCVGIDWLPYADRYPAGEYIQSDFVANGLPQFDDSSVERVYAMNVLEHVPPWKLADVMDELWRVLAKDGQLELIVPDCDSRVYKKDPTHCTMFKPETFTYFIGPRKYYDFSPRGRYWTILECLGPTWEGHENEAERNGLIYATLTPNK